MRWPWEKKDVSLDTMLRNIAMMSMTTSGISVTPENCMRSPTVLSIVTAV